MWSFDAAEFDAVQMGENTDLVKLPGLLDVFLDKKLRFNHLRARRGERGAWRRDHGIRGFTPSALLPAPRKQTGPTSNFHVKPND